MSEADKNELSKVGFLDLYCGFFALCSLALLVLRSLSCIAPEEARLLGWVDLSFCVLFLLELLLRWWKASDKLGFWKWAWIDLVACVPMLPWLRWLRAVRLFGVVIGQGRAAGGLCHVHLFRGRHVKAPVLAFYMFYSIMVMCAPAILWAENGMPGSNLHSAGDAVWWVFETMSTVGYGDFYPVTPLGRAIGGVTMVFGVGMFGVMTATVLSIFGLNLSGSSAENGETEALRKENERLRTQLAGGKNGAADVSQARNDCNLK
jgi:voltage-gated potassium channel